MSQTKTTTANTTVGTTTGAPGQKPERRPASRILQFIIPLVVSVGLCLAMFRDIDFHSMVEVIRHECNFWWIGLMLAISFLAIIFRALRWGIQLRAVSIRPPLRALIYSIVGTYAVNLVFPRLGEVWRTGYIAYREQPPFSTVFGTMIADRFADLLTVAILTTATFVIARDPLVAFVRTYPQAYNAMLDLATSPFTWSALLIIATAIWLLLTRSKNRHILGLKHFLSGIWQGFAAIARMKGKFRWLLLTLCIWSAYFISFAVAFNAFPMTRQLIHSNGLALPLVCFVLTSISMGIPSNGGIGPYQTTLLFGLLLFLPAGADATQFKTVGAAFGNVMIAAQTLMFILLGLITFALIALGKRQKDKRYKDERQKR